MTGRRTELVDAGDDAERRAVLRTCGADPARGAWAFPPPAGPPAAVLEAAPGRAG